jgi:hypothetical protein
MTFLRIVIPLGAHKVADIDLTKPKCVGDVSEQVSGMSSD